MMTTAAEINLLSFIIVWSPELQYVYRFVIGAAMMHAVLVDNNVRVRVRLYRTQITRQKL